MIRICLRCRKRYGTRNDARALGGYRDPFWDPNEDHCYRCRLKLLKEIFGDVDGPAFVLNGCTYTPHGVYGWVFGEKSPSGDVPF